MYIYPDKVKSVNGLLSYFRYIHKTKEYIAITNSEDNLYPKENVLNILTPQFWGSSDSTDPIWIGISFLHYNIKVSHYTIRQYVGDGNMLKTWIFQGSNDDITWDDLDSQNSKDFCQLGETLDTFSVPESKQNYYKKYRFYKNGSSCLYPTFWRLSGIELFGVVGDYDFSNSIKKITNIPRIFPNIKPFVLIYLLS